jgi:uridine kinase
MAVENRILKIQKRNRALVRFDQERICQAILRAAQSIGGFRRDYLPGINEKLFEAWSDDAALARFVAEMVTVVLNSNPQYLITNFPPTIEKIQDAVLHGLRSFGLQNTADAYACYRWGRHWLREGAISPEQFIGNGIPEARAKRALAWNRKRNCDSLDGLNEIIRNGKLRSLVEESLALYEAEVQQTADKILARQGREQKLRMIWITGPTCSAKTTTTIKLVQKLEQAGLRLAMLNVDDYFWSLVEHPTDWINDRNYETPEALDIQQLNADLRRLLEGGVAQKPVFSFKEGRTLTSKPIHLGKDQVLLLDCLHGLYPPMTEGIDGSVQFRLYLDAQIGVYERGAETNPIRSSDVRLMRRMLRDGRHRNYSSLHTLLHWHYVRAGELFSILPLSGLADHVINTGFAFELAALGSFFHGSASQLPRPQDLEAYPGFLDARICYRRLQSILQKLEPIPPETFKDHELIPGDALVREFIGGSTLSIPHND